jgi:hypothetical protein
MCGSLLLTVENISGAALFVNSQISEHERSTAFDVLYDEHHSDCMKNECEARLRDFVRWRLRWLLGIASPPQTGSV